jgi:hypothetical protein
VTVIARLKTGQVATVTDPRGNDTVYDYEPPGADDCHLAALADPVYQN